jgi:hypothetical protein
LKITARTSLRSVAIAVGRALADHGIRAVLTGGACASIHSNGSYVSEDVDFVLEGRVQLARLDQAMASVGFEREANRYVHPLTSFWVEFPRGPLALGADLDVTPVLLDGRKARVLALSPSDSCRDRLAAFYHWNDRQSLDVAVKIAARHPVDLVGIRRWSEGEGQLARFGEFLRERARRAARSAGAGKRPRARRGPRS